MSGAGKISRNLKTDKTAEQYIKNWRTYYNFIKSYMAFNGPTRSLR